MRITRFSGWIVSMLLAFPPANALADPQCFCRHRDGATPEGKTACIRMPQGMRLARCERVLNNTSWKILDVPCPSAQRRSGNNTSG
jgi:hypothetical protein